MLDPKRFIRFTQMLDATQKAVHRLELGFAPYFGVKSVHIFWLYELMQYPDGLRAAELAKCRMVDRSLVSREIADLLEDGLVEKTETARLRLTERGKEAARRIDVMALAIQNEASSSISEEELLSFYTTFEKIRTNLTGMATAMREALPITPEEGATYAQKL